METTIGLYRGYIRVIFGLGIASVSRLALLLIFEKKVRMTLGS